MYIQKLYFADKMNVSSTHVYLVVLLISRFPYGNICLDTTETTAVLSYFTSLSCNTRVCIFCHCDWPFHFMWFIRFFNNYLHLLLKLRYKRFIANIFHLLYKIYFILIKNKSSYDSNKISLTYDIFPQLRSMYTTIHIW